MTPALDPQAVRAQATRRTALGAMLIASMLAGGCLPHTYEIHRAELARLAATPPDLRGSRVEVEQELVGTDLENAPPVNSNTQVVVVGSVNVGSGGSYRHPRPGGGGSFGGGGGSSGGKATDARAAAVAILVMATFGVVLAAAIEAQRYEGTVELHPMHPVHLLGRDGGYAVVPLAQLDGNAVGWSERAVIRSREGPFRFLDRAPLRRTGLTYGVHFGVSQLASADGTKTSGPNGLVQFGYFPSQIVGVLGTASFAWRANRVGYNVYEQRYGAELQIMPLSVEIFHAGGYGGVGLAWRLEDGFSRGNERGSTLSGGGQLQLDVNTHIGLSLRAGVHTAHGEVLREVTFGMAVY